MYLQMQEALQTPRRKKTRKKLQQEYHNQIDEMCDKANSSTRNKSYDLKGINVRMTGFSPETTEVKK